MVFLSMLISSIRYSTVFLFGATGETIIEKSGHLNLGIPGIMCIGAIGGCTGVSLYMGSLADPAQASGFACVLVAIIMAMLCAGAMGLLYGFFTITLRCNQNVTGLTITTFGAGLLKYWGIRKGAAGFTYASSFFKTFFPASWYESGFGKVFFSYGSLVYLAFVIAIITAIIFKRTRTGLNLKAVGENPATADAVGINVTKYKYVSCILGAAIAGIGGLFYVMDQSDGHLEYVIEGLGWLAVALVIFSMWRPGLCIIGSIVFGFLSTLSATLNPTFAQMKLLDMLPYLVTVIVLIITSIINKRETQPPASLGLSYFREER